MATGSCQGSHLNPIHFGTATAQSPGPVPEERIRETLQLRSGGWQKTEAERSGPLARRTSGAATMAKGGRMAWRWPQVPAVPDTDADGSER